MTALDELAGRVAGGEALSGAEAQVLLDTPDLIAVGSLGDDVRRRMHGTRTTFVRVFEVHAGAPPAALPGEVTAGEAALKGCTTTDGRPAVRSAGLQACLAAGEFRIVGRPAGFAAALEAVRATFRLASGVPVIGFALSDLQTLASAEGRPLDEVVAGLRDAGLEAIAEVPLDVCDGAAGAIETARGAGLRVERLTVHALAPEARIGIVERARDLQDLVGGFQAFAPLARTLSTVAPTTGYEDVKQVAIARLVAANIPSIQIDWQLYGPKLAQVALTVGADDVDGVAAFEPGTLGARRSALEEIRRNIRAAALDPVERDGRYALL